MNKTWASFICTTQHRLYHELKCVLSPLVIKSSSKWDEWKGAPSCTNKNRISDGKGKATSYFQEKFIWWIILLPFLFNYENMFWRRLCQSFLNCAQQKPSLATWEERAPGEWDKLFLRPHSSFLPVSHSDLLCNIPMKSITKNTEAISLARTHAFNLLKVLLVVNHLSSLWAVWKLVGIIRMPALQRSYCFLQGWDLNSDWNFRFWHSA